MHLCSSRHFPEKGLYCSRRPCSNKRPLQISAHLLGLNVKQAPPPPSNNHPPPSLSQSSNLFLLPIYLQLYNLQLQLQNRKRRIVSIVFQLFLSPRACRVPIQCALGEWRKPPRNVYNNVVFNQGSFWTRTLSRFNISSSVYLAL